MARIDLEGMEELTDLLNKITINDADERKAMQLALEPVKNEVEKNAPMNTGKLKASVKIQVKREYGQNVGKVILKEYYGRFQEYGTSHQNKNVGFFARSIRISKSEVMRILKSELLKRSL